MARKEFKLTDEQLGKLFEASRPQPYIVVGGVPPMTPQETANIAWQALAKELGFIWDTVRPIPGKAVAYFTAEESPVACSD